ncbi:glycerol-3-phosphate dehydrogenase/oxidase [Paenibacillus sp. N1-5-1-14]|uniref:glycerol-3-phosphate dehydrogenase/oxidase n=1 Tax=Paenibacillus radicibacter TaxID=2972488 RepID=UPI002158F75A|nr:glycerol-3-phosphate dehydrogenase/oxidase [Paenibacillus radicibacter]MCR8643845.1 glycerol-3-phosphate dehydrogenase/oxidase [Paenibacillus radicibacter]
MELLSVNERINYLRKMAKQQLDLFVIGGGITGAGIAWDASVRGMKVGLVDMNDFASGTSSRSTKLIHGGLRYLKQGEIRLVQEVGRERALLHKSTPYLVDPIPMMLPIYKKGTYGYFASMIGLYVYDWLAGVKRSERRKMYGRTQTMLLEPLFKTDGLKGSGYYYEYRTDDARLTVEIMKSAVKSGSIVSNYAKVTDFIYRENRIVGVRVEDRLSGEQFEIYAKKIVNAAGPWVDELRKIDHSLQGKHLLLTKGIHLVVDAKRLPINQAAYFDVPDGRMIFAIPRGTKTYIGTTDTVYKGNPEEPHISTEDRQYVIDAVNEAFPSVNLTVSDIESGWSGLRPLVHEEGKSPSEVSRKDEMFISERGLITIAGGKLTGFRKMAEKVVNLVSSQLRDEEGRIFPPCTTDRECISGGIAQGSETFEQNRARMIGAGKTYGMTESQVLDLLTRYGTNVEHIYEYVSTLQQESTSRQSLADQVLTAEIRYAVEYEMAAMACDFLLRRTGWILFDRSKAERVLNAVLRLMGQLLEWDQNETNKQRLEVEKQLQLAVGQ